MKSRQAPVDGAARRQTMNAGHLDDIKLEKMKGVVQVDHSIAPIYYIQEDDRLIIVISVVSGNVFLPFAKDSVGRVITVKRKLAYPSSSLLKVSGGDLIDGAYTIATLGGVDIDAITVEGVEDGYWAVIGMYGTVVLS